MDNVIYKRDSYIVFKACGGYVIYNQSKDFQVGHTHFKSFKKAKSCIDLVIRHKIPQSESIRFLGSLKRLSDDKEYCDNIEVLIQTKKQKGKKDKYYNRGNFKND